jgi:hypothetical protein
LSEGPSDDPSFGDDVEEKLERWEPEGIVDDPYDPESELMEFLSTSRSEYRDALGLVPELENLLQIYADHPWEVETAAATGSSEADENGLDVMFDTEDISNIDGWSVSDYRFTDDRRDFDISIDVDGDRHLTFGLVDNYISDFDIRVAQWSVGKFDLPPEDYWGYDVGDQDPNEMVHALIVTISDSCRNSSTSSGRYQITAWNRRTWETTISTFRETGDSAAADRRERHRT